MTRYSVQPRDKIFVKSYAFLSFARSMGKSQKFFDHAKKYATDALKTASKRGIHIQ